MSEAAAIRVVYPRYTMKLLARRMGLPLDTARHWLYRNLCPARRRELALALLAEMDRQDAEERADARRQLTEMAGGAHATLDRLPIGTAVQPDRAAGQVPRGLAAASAAPLATPAGAQAGGVERAVIRR
jgi:hypothetical protein